MGATNSARMQKYTFILPSSNEFFISFQQIGSAQNKQPNCPHTYIPCHNTGHFSAICSDIIPGYIFHNIELVIFGIIYEVFTDKTQFIPV